MTTYRGDRIELDLEGVRRLDVRIVGGEVNVSASNGEPGSTARVEVDVLRGPDAVVELDDEGTLVVEQVPPRSVGGFLGLNFGSGAGNAVRANVTVVVPAATPTHVRTVNGDAFVGGIEAGTSIATVSGRVTATGLDTDVSLKTVSGDVEVQGLGGRVSVNTVSGDLTISGGDPDEVTVRSVSGDVTLDLDDDADLDCTTVSGDVAVRLPADAGIDLDVVTVSGRLETSFPDDRLDGGKRRLRGRIGAGDHRLRARTTSGDVVVLRRSDATTATAEAR